LRRKQIATIRKDLEAIAERIEAVQDDEQEALDALPWSLRDSPTAETMHEALDALGQAVDQVAELSESLETAAA
jgi:uncharacterized protein YukE